MENQDYRSALERVSGVERMENGTYKSTNYEFLTMYKGNRYSLVNESGPNVSMEEKDMAAKTFKGIEKMFLSYGEYTGNKGEKMYDPNIPMLVAFLDGKFVLIDGQNRLSVCKENQIPFYFRMVEGINNESDVLNYIKRLNYCKTSWTRTQQIGSEARIGNKYAQSIIELSRRYNVPIVNILYFTLGKDSTRSKFNFTVTEFDMGRAEAILKLANQVADNCTSNAKEKLSMLKHNKFTNFVTNAYDLKLSKTLLKKSMTKQVTKIKYANTMYSYPAAFGMLRSFQEAKAKEMEALGK